MQNQECSFCDQENLASRMIRQGKLCSSFISSPWFRPGHCLVVPNRHITTVAELDANEAGDIMAEVGRLACRLDHGYGSGVMQKYQPLQPENGIKVNHLHFHVFPRRAHEDGLFPVPEPNNFSGFVMPDDSQAAYWQELARL